MRFSTILTIVLVAVFICVGAGIAVKSIQFDRGCGGHLKRAADANSIELAIKELETATKYMRENNLTIGYTSVVYQTPDEDVGYWYKNINDSLVELQELPETAQPLTKSNMLMKLRETLCDEGEKGTELTTPKGISRYPNNGMWAFWLCFTLLGSMVGVCLCFFRSSY